MSRSRARLARSPCRVSAGRQRLIYTEAGRGTKAAPLAQAANGGPKAVRSWANVVVGRRRPEIQGASSRMRRALSRLRGSASAHARLPARTRLELAASPALSETGSPPSAMDVARPRRPMIEELPLPDQPATAPGPPPVPATPARPPLAPPGPATEALLAPLPVKPNTWPTAFAGVLGRARCRAPSCRRTPSARAATVRRPSPPTTSTCRRRRWRSSSTRWEQGASVVRPPAEVLHAGRRGARRRLARVHSITRGGGTGARAQSRRAAAAAARGGPAPKKKAASAPAKRPPAKKRRTVPTPTPRKPKSVPAPRPPDECWCIGEGADIAVRRVTIDGQEVVHICDLVRPGHHRERRPVAGRRDLPRPAPSASSTRATTPTSCGMPAAGRLCPRRWATPSLGW